MKNYFLLLIAICLSSTAFCQVYFTRTGYVSFYSKAPLEDIKAENQQLFCIIDLAKKEVAFTVLMKGFEFQKDLMQTHFNENYVESDKYPKASFSGTFQGELDAKAASENNIKVTGNLTLHGVTKSIEIPAKLHFVNDRLVGETTFNVSTADYNISIPALVRDKIAKQVQVQIKINSEIKN